MISKSKFVVPDERMRLRGLGNLTKASEKVRTKLERIIPLFKPIPEPKSSDWLAAHPETGQTFETFINAIHNYPNKRTNVIYIQPLELVIDKDFLSLLRDYCQAFFCGLEIRILDHINLDAAKVDSRKNPFSAHKQYNAMEILVHLRSLLPKDAFCLLGALMTDLYPKDEWNFGDSWFPSFELFTNFLVFGMASIEERTGVFSFARYHDRFYEDPSAPFKMEPRVLYRSCRVIYSISVKILRLICLGNDSWNWTYVRITSLHLL